MTDSSDVAETYERWTGPVRSIIRRGQMIPLAPPLPGETRPFMWMTEPDEVVAMDIEGRAVERATFMTNDGDRGTLVVLFKDGDEVTYDQGPISTSSCHE